MVQAYVTALPGTELDAYNFERIGWEMAQGSWHDVLGSFTSGALLYSWIIAVCYWMTDRSALMIQMINVLLGTLVVKNVYDLARVLWNGESAVRAAWVAACFPLMVYHSGVTLREQMVIYPLTLAAYFIARWRMSDHPGWVVAAVAAFGVGIAFHVAVFGALIYLGLAIGARWAAALRRGQVGNAAKMMLGFGLLLALLSAVLLAGWGASGKWITALTSLEPTQARQGAAPTDRTDYLRDLIVRSPVDFLWQWPIRVFFFFYMPFPWLVAGLLDLIGLVDSMLFAWIAWKLSKAWRTVWASPPARSILLLTLMLSLVFAMVISNYGTAIRHRNKLAPLYIALIAGVIAPPRRERAAVTQPEMVQ
jgi:4-amino-4-deoxy-L-arabinose transferase-like glycosyltransferase